jgi:(p)ppGpp synthase/HD superfamily hydrolase
MNDSQLSSLLRAISFAAREHRHQTRKDGLTPYSAHVLRVMTIAAIEFGIDDPQVLTAAALHDTIEDTTVDRDELIEEFGERVAKIVATLSKDKRLPEDQRERIYFDGLAEAPVEVKLCKLADIIDNLIDSQACRPRIGGRRSIRPSSWSSDSPRDSPPAGGTRLIARDRRSNAPAAACSFRGPDLRSEHAEAGLSG